MLPTSDSFTFAYSGSDIMYGRGCVERLGYWLMERNLSDALVVCGSNVGANGELMDLLIQGIGDRVTGIFDGTTPEKTASTVFNGVDAMRESEADVLIGVGGGSSLDIARQMSVFAGDGRSLSDFRREALEKGSVSRTVNQSLTPVVVIPTTFAGAGISRGGSIEILDAEDSPTGQPIRANGSVLPDAMVYDPDLFETTPMSVLTGSAMNGFDKGIETVYANSATPITDATAVRGLRFLRDGYPDLTTDPKATEQAVIGLILVQFKRKISLVHAFSHGFARHYPVQQGVIHAILVPHVLRYLFNEVDGRRSVLAEGLSLDQSTISNKDLPEAIVNEVIAVRDSFDLPSRLRDVDVIDEGDLTTISELVLADGLMHNAPEQLDPSTNEIEAVLRAAW